jgi:hypothetical protein
MTVEQSLTPFDQFEKPILKLNANIAKATILKGNCPPFSRIAVGIQFQEPHQNPAAGAVVAVLVVVAVIRIRIVIFLSIIYQ